MGNIVLTFYDLLLIIFILLLGIAIAGNIYDRRMEKKNQDKKDYNSLKRFIKDK